MSLGKISMVRKRKNIYLLILQIIVLNFVHIHIDYQMELIAYLISDTHVQ